MRFIRLAAVALAALIAAGCEPSPPRPAASSRVPAPVSAASATPVVPVAAASAAPAPEPSADLTRSGNHAPAAAYFWVEAQGLVRLDEGGVTVVAPTDERFFGSFVDLVATRSGKLWLDGHPDVSLSLVGDTTRVVKRTGASFALIAPGKGDDAWLVTHEIEWDVVHFDGQRLRKVATRQTFAGYFDDNKRTAIAVHDGEPWLSCWNGFFRFDGKRWLPVDLPPMLPTPELDSAPVRPRQLFATDAGLVAVFGGAPFLRDGEGWTKLPRGVPHLYDLSRDGVAVMNADPRITIGPLDDPTVTITTPSFGEGFIYDAVFDERGRTWVATDHALYVFDGRGRELRRYRKGELAGITGAVRKLEVIGAGPAELPAVKARPGRRLIGRLLPARGGPISGLEVRLCTSGAASAKCHGAPFSRETKARADGSFTFEDVPPGDYALVPIPPVGNTQCDGVFPADPVFTDTSSDCMSEDDGTCDLGDLGICRAFEMPPRR